MKINHVVFSILMLLLVFSLVSCAHSANIPRGSDLTTDDLNVSNPNNENDQNNEPVFLIVMSENTSDKLKGEFKDAEQYGVCCSASREVLDDLDEHTLKNLTGTQILKYSYSECSYKNNLSKELGKHYSVYDIYKTEDVEIGVLHGTDLICYYYNGSSDNDSVAELTDEAAKSFADAFIVSLVGADVHSEFNIVTVKSDTSGLFSHVINYTRLTGGHKTDENMTVYIDKSGTIVGYNGYNVSKYDTLRDKFVDEKINSAIDSLINKIDSLDLKNINKNEPVITTDTDGALFIRIDFSYEDDYGSVCGETVLINVG